MRLVRTVPDVPKGASYHCDVLDAKDPRLGDVKVLRIRWKRGVQPSIAEQVSVVHRLFDMRSTDFEKIEDRGSFVLERRIPVNA